jgi:hypothetical protein
MLVLALCAVLSLGAAAESLAGQQAAQPAAAEAAQGQGTAQPAPAGSNAPAEAKEPPTPPHTGLRALGTGLLGDVEHLPSIENMYLAIAGGGMAVAAHSLDSTFNVHLRSHYDLVNDAYAPAKYLGDTPEQIGLSLATYAYGRLFDEPKVSHLGMDLIRAQIVTEGLVQALKWSTRRCRPDGSNCLGFPSGHSAQTFAAATVLERHLGWRRAALAYAVAAYVATSRLHDNRHYLSDVVFGAAVGTISGRTITQHGPQNWALVAVPAPGGGVALALTRTH